jgi:tetratricopeptide (TPR) repeat protein
LDIALANYDPIAHAGLANQFGQDIGVTIHLFQAWNSLMLGRTRRAATHMDKTESLAMATDHINTICYALLHRAILSLMSGDGPDAERCINVVAPIAQEHNLALWLESLSMNTDAVAAFKGDKASIEKYRKAEGLATTRKKVNIPNHRVSIARSALAMGLRKEAAELAMMAQEIIDETGETYALSDLHRVQAAIAMAGDDAEAAEERLGAALDVARRQGGKLYELRAAIDLARLWQGQGRVDEAIAVLRPIHASIADGDCPEDQAAATELLAELAG